MQQCHMMSKRKMLCLTGNGSLLSSSCCPCIPPPQNCTLRGKWSENSQWIIHLIITDFFFFSAWKPPEISGTSRNKGMAASQSLPKPEWECFLLLYWLWVRTSLRYTFGCLAKPMIFFPPVQKTQELEIYMESGTCKYSKCLLLLCIFYEHFS